MLVTEATGLRSRPRRGPGQGDRPARLGRGERPLDRAAGRPGAGRAPGEARREARRALARRSAGAVAGMQLGLMLAYMATRVLGQYDLLIDDHETSAEGDQDLVSYVGPNIVGRRDAVRLRAQPVPALAGPARGDAPHAVHRRALAAGPLRRPGDRAARAAVGRPGRLRRGRQARRRRRSGPGATRAREAGVVGMLATPEQRSRSRRSAG